MPRLRRGDTIIEVLMAMAIMGLILSAAYATASRNLRTSQLTAERTDALKVAEEQIEVMKSLSGEERTLLNSKPNTASFCIRRNPAAVAVDRFPGGTDQYCTTRGESSRYAVSIEPGGSGNSRFYRVLVRWTPPGGSDDADKKAEVKLTYRYPQ